MNDLTLSTEPDAVCSQYICDRLRQYNDAHSSAFTLTSQTEPSTVEMYLLDKEQTVIGGLTGRTNSIPEWLEISILWVDESWRGQGLGRRLIMAAEQEAQRRGCRFARLTTSSFQDPNFHTRLGYVLYGTLEDRPAGVTASYLRKDVSHNQL